MRRMQRPRILRVRPPSMRGHRRGRTTKQTRRFPRRPERSRACESCPELGGNSVANTPGLCSQDPESGRHRYCKHQYLALRNRSRLSTQFSFSRNFHSASGNGDPDTSISGMAHQEVGMLRSLRIHPSGRSPRHSPVIGRSTPHADLGRRLAAQCSIELIHCSGGLEIRNSRFKNSKLTL
jgi:hypothetical protein